MNWFDLGNAARRRAYDSALSFAIKRRPVTKWITTSGPEAATNDVVSILIDADGTAPKIITGRHDDFLICLESDGERYSSFEREVEVPIASVDPCQFYISHYYGMHELHYRGIWKFWRAIIFRVPYLQIRFGIAKEKFAQARFNKRGLVIYDRIKVLRTTIALLDEREKNAFTRWDVLMAIYSTRAIEHPDQERAARFITMHLDTFVESGELRKAITEYSVQPKAIQTLEEYERSERRQKDIDNQQKWIIRLTWLLVIMSFLQAIAAAIQGKVILVPALLDLTK